MRIKMHKNLWKIEHIKYLTQLGNSVYNKGQYSSDGRVVRASASEHVDLGLIPSRVKPRLWNCRLDRHLTGFSHHVVVDTWMATSKRAGTAHWSLSRDGRIDMPLNTKVRWLIFFAQQSHLKFSWQTFHQSRDPPLIEISSYENALHHAVVLNLLWFVAPFWRLSTPVAFCSATKFSIGILFIAATAVRCS